MIKIGLQPTESGKQTATKLQNIISSLNYDEKFINLKKEDFTKSEVSYHEIYTFEGISELLLSENIDVFIFPLKEIPILSSHEGVTIAALSERKNLEDCIIIQKTHVDDQQLLRLPISSSVACNNNRRSAQLSHYRPDINIVNESIDSIQKLRESNCVAVITDKDSIQGIEDCEDIEIITLNPKEFVPAAGQGALAYLCRKEDKAVRRILASLHNTKTATCTNVERTLLLELLKDKNNVGVYCENPEQKLFRLYANYNNGDGMEVYSIAQSTTIGLADNLFEKLRKKII